MGLSAMPTNGNSNGNGNGGNEFNGNGNSNYNGNNGNGNMSTTVKREPLGTLFTGREDVGGPDPKRMRR